MQIVQSQSGPYLGLFTAAPGVSQAVDFQTASGVPPAIVHIHGDWTVPNSDGTRSFVDFEADNVTLGTSVRQMADDLARQGQMLALSWDPLSLNDLKDDFSSGASDSGITIQSILDGTHDAYITQVAQQAAALGEPILMTLFGEANAAALISYGANGDEFVEKVTDRTGQYGAPDVEDGPERVRDAFKHVIDLFDAAGAQNVNWYMYMSTDYMTEADDIGPAAFYPGDDYIDWIGQSVYVADPTNIPASLDAGYAAWAQVTDKPFFIPEFGLTTADGPNSLGVALDALKQYDRVGAVTISDFPAAAEDYGVPRLGNRAGDWSGIAAAGYDDQVMIKSADSGTLTFADWRNVTGHSADDKTQRGTEEADVLFAQTSGSSLFGYGGDDLYIIEQKTDRAIEFAQDGHDTIYTFVSIEMDPNIEQLIMGGTDNLTAFGTDAGNEMYGNDGNNYLAGRGGNDTLSGGAGADTLEGGAGDDFYIIGAASDIVVEASNGGTDTVVASVGVDMWDNVEVLVLDGSGNFNVRGTAAGDDITGNSGNNILRGEAGNDTVSGGTGNDMVFGGDGADTLYGGAGDDFIFGNAGSDILVGGDGNDSLALDGGADYAVGGAGKDTFAIGASSDMMIVEDFVLGEDVLDVSALAYNDFASFRTSAQTVSGGLWIDLTGGGSALIMGLTVGTMTADDVVI